MSWGGSAFWPSVQKTRHAGPGSGSHWKDIAFRPLLAEKTTDPEAINHDKATELFQKGMKLARSGDLHRAASHIAGASLLDGRSIVLALHTPPSGEPEATEYIMDRGLLSRLMRCDGGSGSPEGIVMRLAGALRLGRVPEAQGLVTAALRETDELIKAINANPTLEDDINGPLCGNLSRPVLHFNLHMLCMGLGNHAEAIKQLNAALKYDHSQNANCRFLRAKLYASTNTKNENVVFREIEKAVVEAHPDARFLNEA